MIFVDKSHREIYDEVLLRKNIADIYFDGKVVNLDWLKKVTLM